MFRSVRSSQSQQVLAGDCELVDGFVVISVYLRPDYNA